MNQILEMQKLTVETEADPLGVLKTSTLSVNCTSGRTIFAPVDE
jgi:hypothetical protein